MNIRSRSGSFAAAAALALLTSPLAVDALAAQSAQRQAAETAVPVKVDVVITRHKGEALVSSLPFSLYVRAAERHGNASVRMGVDVPVGTTTVTRNPYAEAGGQGTTTTSSRPDYRYVGTSVDCRVATAENGFLVFVNIQDSSIHTTAGETMPARIDSSAMAFRSFSLSNELPMQAGQTTEFGVATDKITGETIKVSVTINVAR
jgi:hypothetical protein